MATFKGKDGAVYIEGVVVAEVRSFSLTETANEVDTSVMNTDWTKVDTTQNSWEAAMEMFWDPDDAGQIGVVLGDKVTVDLYPQGNATTLVKRSGSCLVTQIETSQSHDNIVEANVTLKGDGILSKEVVA